ncbi:hypothetical protein [Candidatus Enterococcus ferrettii]|uniref:Uncharacterized protein n=1 Tax=Candidatus Enterococcus ferrettii TaxID=2815324 RepID=A0ABV0EL56_9ENTE|nr:hypothetical protein [Enterococcus sp. 665A]MBO1338140.1 hypothetical protein [Enterococcus sp. 665A]
MYKLISSFELPNENDLALKTDHVSENHVLSLVFPVPDRNESMLFYENKQYHQPNQTLTTLQKYAKQNNFLDYSSLTHSLKRFNRFSKRNSPIASLSAVLFPLGHPQHSPWINPAEIYELKESGVFTMIHLLNGLTIQTTLTVRTIRNRSEEALSILSMLKRDYLQSGFTCSTAPLNLLQLPDTPFLRSISKRAMLQDFPLPIYALKEAYEQDHALQTFLRLGRSIDPAEWNYETFSDLLTKLIN